jgi:hypothetical protein
MNEFDPENPQACPSAIGSLVGIESGDMLLSFGFNPWSRSLGAIAEELCLQD